jgi:hypothetical protein
LADHQPYVNSPKQALDRVKREQLLAEYNSLVESIDVATVTVQKILTFSDSSYTIKYIPQKNRFDFYIGNEYRSSNVTFSEDDKIAKVIVPTRNSDTHGELVNYVYTLKIAEPVNPTIKKAKAEPPSNKIEEGLAAKPSKDDTYFKSMGLVKDSINGTLRKQTTQEYDEQLKQQQKKAVPSQKNSKISFGRFFKK